MTCHGDNLMCMSHTIASVDKNVWMDGSTAMGK